MAYLQRSWKRFDKKLFGWSVLVGIVLTAIGAYLPFVHRVTSVVLLMIIVNGGYSIYTGIRIAKKDLNWWELFLFPICYIIGAYIYLPHYTFYFTLVYLGIAYLSYSMSKQKL
ncbi:hypothetical protein ABTQ33_07225 [Paucilactobacillus suebicus]|uniref:Integral membrane protein n=1 Tax=Paucilactobacillus suebicus DSM 5007 = KCTC 3549 TaxID=1423807 RepID=A0A0R1W333_9LACO|nr:hypothetical protein [Paucilactobacillus suebicus]KRM12074.1 hypothetical protein FD16_GL000286 [Paucilactobacillus suebicus DSM 5007 = KCTC 3549]